MWVYSIKFHTLFAPGGGVVSTDCYSGHPPYVNDPTAIALKGQGPLPPGDYTIHPSVTHPELGIIAMFLEPWQENNMLNRSGFFMHGDSENHPGFASEGCIVAPHTTRCFVDSSTDKHLKVVLESLL